MALKNVINIIPLAANRLSKFCNRDSLLVNFIFNEFTDGYFLFHNLRVIFFRCKVRSHSPKCKGIGVSFHCAFFSYHISKHLQWIEYVTFAFDVTDYVGFSTFKVIVEKDKRKHDLSNGLILFGNVIPLSVDVGHAFLGGCDGLKAVVPCRSFHAGSGVLAG